MGMKNHFQLNGLVLSLALKQRLEATRLCLIKGVLDLSLPNVAKGKIRQKNPKFHFVKF